MPTTFGTHCIGCPFHNTAQLSAVERQMRSTPLSMEDNGGSVLLIFQAPGIDEWATGMPVSSVNPRSAGAKLAAAFLKAGKTRSDYNITNTVQCYPGKLAKRYEGRPRDKAPPAAARNHCAGWLRQDIESHSYERVVVFGSLARTAVKALGLCRDTTLQFVKHPTGGLAKASLLAAVA